MVSVQPTQYTVSILPEDDLYYDIYAVTVEYRGPECWAVMRGRRCLGADGVWDLGQRYNDDQWMASHRFDLDTALRLAREAAPNVKTNGWTAAEVLAELSRGDGQR